MPDEPRAGRRGFRSGRRRTEVGARQGAAGCRRSQLTNGARARERERSVNAGRTARGEGGDAWPTRRWAALPSCWEADLRWHRRGDRARDLSVSGLPRGTAGRGGWVEGCQTLSLWRVRRQRQSLRLLVGSSPSQPLTSRAVRHHHRTPGPGRVRQCTTRHHNTTCISLSFSTLLRRP